MRRFFKYLLPALSIIIVGVTPAFSEVVTFTKEYTYQASDFDSRHSSRTIALETVKRQLLEELGTYLVSETKVKNMELTKDQVTTYSVGIVGAEIIDEKWDGKSYWLKAKVTADPKEVEKSLKKIVEDKSKTQELEETRKKAEALTKENERLRGELHAKASKHNTKAQSKNILAYENTIKGLNAIDWFDKRAVFQAYKEQHDGWTSEIVNLQTSIDKNKDILKSREESIRKFREIDDYSGVKMIRNWQIETATLIEENKKRMKELQEKKQDLKIKLLEKYDSLPPWWVN